MTRPFRLPTASDPVLQAAKRLRGLLAILEDCGASEVPVERVALGPVSDAEPPTFAEMMAVIGKRAKRRAE